MNRGLGTTLSKQSQRVIWENVDKGLGYSITDFSWGADQIMILQDVIGIFVLANRIILLMMKVSPFRVSWAFTLQIMCHRVHRPDCKRPGHGGLILIKQNEKTTLSI